MKYMRDFKRIVGDLKFNGWAFEIKYDLANGEAGDYPSTRCYLQLKAITDDNVTGNRAVWFGRKWLLSPHMTRSEVVSTAFKAIMTAIEHETREQFLYQGRAIYDPHYDVDSLWDLRGKTHILDERK